VLLRKRRDVHGLFSFRITLAMLAVESVQDSDRVAVYHLCVKTRMGRMLYMACRDDLSHLTQLSSLRLLMVIFL
jgi:hypothetical protein